MYSRSGLLIARALWRCCGCAEPIEKLSLVQCFHRKWICPAKRKAWSAPQHDRSRNIIAQLSPQVGMVSAMHDDCRFEPPGGSQLEGPLLVAGKLDSVA